MKKVYFLSLMILGWINTLAQTLERAPLNPDFINYIEYKKSESGKKSADEHGKGFVPSPLKVHFNTVEHTNKKNLEAFPSYYNLKDYGWVTPVRDQGAVGACWSFATMGAIESRWLKLGFGTSLSLNLSEQNLATCHGFEAGIDDGGSDYIAAAYLSRLSGPVTEASHPYNPSKLATCKTTGLVIPAYSPQTLWFPKDINVIKKAVLDYGAVTGSIHMGVYTQYLNNLDGTYFYNGTSPVDHAVLVVGWDDNKVVTGNIYKPLNKGAWIVKNSWGTTFGKSGYFYVSYEDSRFLTDCSIYPERVEKTEIDTLIMYDFLGATETSGFRTDSASAVAKFVASQKMFVNKIGTFINSEGSFVNIDIYKEFTGDSVLNNLIGSSHNNFCKYPGYYTFDISALVEGDYFVKVRYYTPGYNYPIPLETEIIYQGEAYALPKIEDPGKFWISSEGKKWLPLGKGIENYEADLCVRVYADRNTNLNAFFTADKTKVCVNSNLVVEDKTNGTINTYAWDFGEGASPATASTKGPHTISYSTPGLKTITLTVSGPSGTDILSRNSYVEVVNELDIFLPYTEKLLVNGKSLTLTAFGADNYSWSPAYGLNTTSGSVVTASPSDTTIYTVTGTMGSCSGSASIKINSVNGPANDDACSALELSQGVHTFKNIYATKEDNEPAPPEGDCNTPLKWCVEGGIQNSIWFWFIAPPTGKVSFTTDGMDTQIALYKAENCDSVLNGHANLIAANDDYFGEDKFFAAALNMVDVIPGQKYYLQVDGSAGGEEGQFTLIYWEAPLAVQEFSSDLDLRLYPNPNNGEFSFTYNSGTAQNVHIRIINPGGQVLFEKQIKNANQDAQKVNLGKIAQGLYIFELVSDKKVSRKNFMIQ